MKKYKLAALALAAVLCLGMTACSGSGTQESGSPAPDETTPVAASDLQYVKDKGVMVVGVTDYPPLDYQDDNGEWVGFDADMCRAVADALGVECQFVSIDWSKKLLELENKSIDVIWNGMTLTEEVANGSNPTMGYLNNGQVLVMTAENAEKYQSGALTLADLTPAVESGSSGELVLVDQGLNYVAVEAQVDALMEVAAGTSDSCVIDKLLAAVSTGEGTDYSNLVIVEQLETELDVAACRKDSDLTDFINEQLTALYENGTIAALAEQYSITDLVCKPE